MAMDRMTAAAVVVLVCWAAAASGAESRNGSARYGFYREMGAGGGRRAGGGGTRRVFGGASASLGAFPAACALLDRYWAARCSGAVLAARWALTAAHCISPALAYVKYNSRRPADPGGDVAPVHYLYRHPRYKVVQEDEGRGVDVTLLHHDVGLVRTRRDMRLAARVSGDPLRAMRQYNPVDLKNEEVQVLGFGRTERSRLGEELFAVRLRLVFCERGAWFHCVCGAAAGRDSRGVCSGDSGGPVLYRGAQVGVTSMGPLECESGGGAGAAGVGATPAAGATSVFTALFHYAELLNDTIHDTERALRMERMSAAITTHPTHATLVTLLLLQLSAT